MRATITTIVAILMAMTFSGCAGNALQAGITAVAFATNETVRQISMDTEVVCEDQTFNIVNWKGKATGITTGPFSNFGADSNIRGVVSYSRTLGTTSWQFNTSKDVLIDTDTGKERQCIVTFEQRIQISQSANNLTSLKG